MFKKLFISLMVVGLIFAFTGNGMAGVGEAGWYVKENGTPAGTYKYFKNGHPEGESEWVYCPSCGNDPTSPEVPNGSTVGGVYDGEAWETAKDFDHSGVNDFAFAKSETMIGGTMETFADAVGNGYEYVGRYKGSYDKKWDHGWKYVFVGEGEGKYDLIPNKASQEVKMILVAYDGNVHACSFDNGLYSQSYAKAELGDSYAKFTGDVYGKGGEDEYIASQIRFGGNLYQKTLAKEVGYNAGYGVAFEQSGASFLMEMPLVEGENLGYFGHYNSNDIDLLFIPVVSFGPEATVKGFSSVEIDPYGSERSLVAHTNNMSYVGFNSNGILNCLAPTPQTVLSNVGGNGIVKGYMSNGPTYGQGIATFNYTGYTQGSGVADLSIVTNNGLNQSSVVINGSSSAVANGSSSAVANGLTIFGNGSY
jgi:hypothetical protein